tara:strand:- start:902 stop:1330 length:429 start_codon:yes stop_codon:yes gene_type:complete
VVVQVLQNNQLKLYQEAMEILPQQLQIKDFRVVALQTLMVGGTQAVVVVQLRLENQQDQVIAQKAVEMVVLVLQQQFQIPQLLMQVEEEDQVMVDLQVQDKVEQVVVVMDQDQVLLQGLLLHRLELVIQVVEVVLVLIPQFH